MRPLIPTLPGRPLQTGRLPLKNKITIGRKDKGDFPEFDLTDIDLKIDTGAYTSAIHCHRIRTEEKAGKETLYFTLLDPSHDQYEKRELSTEQFRVKRVRSSNGNAEERYLIKTKIRLFGKQYSISLTLSERGEMRFPILIGRKFLMGKLIVDPALYDLSYNQKSAQLNKE